MIQNDFKKLQKQWYQKLKEDGFKDIEYKNVLKKGIDWRCHNNNNHQFDRRYKEISEFIWVLEVNAYYNKDISLKNRNIIIRYLDTIQDSKKYREFTKSLPSVNYFYKYYYETKVKLVKFARAFRELQDAEGEWDE